MAFWIGVGGMTIIVVVGVFWMLHSEKKRKEKKHHLETV